MPTYDYKCKACGHTFELFQSMSAQPVKKCPECGKNQANRLIGAGSGLIFKGSGFYQTDYRSDSYKKEAKSESASPAPKTETAPAAPAASESKPGPAKATPA